MMVVSEIELFEALSEQIGKEKAKTILKYLESKVDRRLEEKTNVFATKEDLANAKLDIIKWMVGTAIAVISLVIAGVKLL